MTYYHTQKLVSHSALIREASACLQRLTTGQYIESERAHFGAFGSKWVVLIKPLLSGLRDLCAIVGKKDGKSQSQWMAPRI